MKGSSGRPSRSVADLPEVWQTFRRSSPQWGRIGAHGGGVGADGGASLGPLPQGGRIGATPATVGPIPWPNRKAWPFLTVGMTQPSKKARAVTGPPAALGKTSEDLRPWGRLRKTSVGHTSGRSSGGLPQGVRVGVTPLPHFWKASEDLPPGEGLPSEEVFQKSVAEVFQKVWKRSRARS